MVGLRVIRQATMTDFQAVFDLLWPRVGDVGYGTPCVKATAQHIKDLLQGDGVIFVNDDISAAGAAWLSDGMMCKEKLATGLWLVSERVGDGFAVARALISWGREQGAIVACSARSEFSFFYGRLGMFPRETIFVGGV